MRFEEEGGRGDGYLQLRHGGDVAVEAAFDEVDVGHVELDDHEEHHEEEDERNGEREDVELVAITPRESVGTKTTAYFVRGTERRVTRRTALDRDVHLFSKKEVQRCCVHGFLFSRTSFVPPFLSVCPLSGRRVVPLPFAFLLLFLLLALWVFCGGPVVVSFVSSNEATERKIERKREKEKQHQINKINNQQSSITHQSIMNQTIINQQSTNINQQTTIKHQSINQQSTNINQTSINQQSINHQSSINSKERRKSLKVFVSREKDNDHHLGSEATNMVARTEEENLVVAESRIKAKASW